MNKVEQTIIDVGAAQRTPPWTKVPDCACFRVMAETRLQMIDEAVHACLSQSGLLSALSASGVCTDGTFTFVGAMMLGMTGAIYDTGRDDPRKRPLNDSEAGAFLLLLKDSYQNAVDRFQELQTYYRARGAH